MHKEITPSWADGRATQDPFDQKGKHEELIHHFIEDLWVDVPGRNLGSMFCKCMISPSFKWCIIYWGYNPLIFNFQPDIQLCQNSFRSTQWSWIYFPYIEIVKGAPNPGDHRAPPSWMKIGRPLSRFRFWGSPPARVSPCRTDCPWIHLKHSRAARHAPKILD